MYKISFTILFLFCVGSSFSQTLSQKIQKAYREFEADEQMKYGISSLYVIDARTGQVVFDKNSRVGLAPASTQKIITSATAFEILGAGFRYKTGLWLTGEQAGDTARSDIFIEGSGDPTFGSARYPSTRDEVILGKFVQALRNRGIKYITGAFLYNADATPAQIVPDGWIWEDIGNYYGAASDILNWKENQFDIVLKSSSRVGDSVEIRSPHKQFVNQLRSAPKGTGDNAYVYPPVRGFDPVITGTIPINEDAFTISASDLYPAGTFEWQLSEALRKQGIENDFIEDRLPFGDILDQITRSKKKQLVAEHLSPSLDSIIYWFNRKSINLYGEALVKSLSFEKKGFASTDTGVAILRKFWMENGLEGGELNLYDGSGLSPLNRVTTHAQVHILQYAKNKNWFPALYESLPEYNSMKMKSGTISDVKGFCGYHKSKNGKEYIFSFLVNNYSGRSSSIVAKMYKVLDNLK